MKILRNQTLNRLIDFSIFALFLTNIWTIIYVNFINYLNFIFPPVDKVNFYRPAVAFPERFEMPLYLLFTFLFVIGIWFFLKFIKTHRFKSIPTLIKVLLLFLLLFIFLTKLGIYPLSNEIYPYQLRTNTAIYTIAITLYLAAMILVIIETVLLAKFIKRPFLLTTIYYLLATGTIAVLIFEPRFPVSPLEYAFYFGPIWEIVKGKTIFTDIPSQYGFLSILLFSLLFKLKLFAFSHLSIYAFIMQVIEYFLCFYLIFKISKSAFLGLIALFSIITINYFSFYILPLTIAQYGGLRRLPFFLALFLLYKLKKSDSPLFIFLYALISFWTVDGR